MIAKIESRLISLIKSAAVATLRFGQRLMGAEPTASRAADARLADTHRHDQAAQADRGRDTKLEHQNRADGAT
ncbi:hypothetical protein [Mycolicibacterium sp. XJ1819]